MRSRRLSFWRTCPTWVLTVASLRKSSAAISELVKPRTIRRKTSCSRLVRVSSSDGTSAWPPRARLLPRAAGVLPIDQAAGCGQAGLREARDRGRALHRLDGPAADDFSAA